MGKEKSEAIHTQISAALFTPVQERLLGLLFGQPKRRFQSSELITLVDAGTGATHRQLKRLEKAGLIIAESVGRSRFYRANPDSPVFDELVSLMRKTSGLILPIRDALEQLDPPPERAFVFGSVARAEDDAASDIDLMVVGDELNYRSVYSVLDDAQEKLSRPINPTIYSLEQWARELTEPSSFVNAVIDGPIIRVIESGHGDDESRESG